MRRLRVESLIEVHNCLSICRQPCSDPAPQIDKAVKSFDTQSDKAKESLNTWENLTYIIYTSFGTLICLPSDSVRPSFATFLCLCLPSA